jgi:NADH:ubiquinone oxidoreductase subunit F (NADH-binding)/NADH:ubiquinone oxidoreductase subunit E
VSAPILSDKVPLAHKTDGVFEELKDVQRKLGYLPAAELERIAEERDLYLRDVHAIVSYYPHFRLQRPAKVEVRVCDDMTCHLRGSRALQQDIQQRFEKIPKEDLVIGNVSCLGRCDQAPAIAINDCYYGGCSPEHAISVVQGTLDGHIAHDEDRSASPQMVAKPSKKLEIDPYDGQRPYAALKKFVQTRDWEDLLKELQIAGLRGLGGAGFPTHIKWHRVRKWDRKEKYFVCNADESEPGTIKDRFILTHLPHLVIEGLVLGALCVGAERGYLYIRHEYNDQIAILKAELERCRQERLIGANILGTELSFHLELFVSPGGYICGEESALLEAIEGKRAEPRNRSPLPPLLVDEGLWGKPTVVNNVETLALATAIAFRGANWLNGYGLNGIKGLKFIGISGDVRQPGIYEVPMGIKFTDLIYGEQYGRGVRDGRQLLAFAPSGPSSGYLPASMADLPLDWAALQKAGSILGSSAIVVCGSGACMLDMALNAVRFYRNESCGKCVPCRIGSQQMVEILERWTRGRPQENDRKLVTELSHALRQGSICGLGQILPAPIESVLRHFPAEIDEHLDHRNCRAGICFREGQR